MSSAEDILLKQWTRNCLGLSCRYFGIVLLYPLYWPLYLVLSSTYLNVKELHSFRNLQVNISYLFIIANLFLFCVVVLDKSSLWGTGVLGNCTYKNLYILSSLEWVVLSHLNRYPRSVIKEVDWQKCHCTCSIELPFTSFLHLECSTIYCYSR